MQSGKVKVDKRALERPRSRVMTSDVESDSSKGGTSSEKVLWISY